MNPRTPSPKIERTGILLGLWLLLTAGFLATSIGSYLVSRKAIHHAIEATELPMTSDTVYSEIQKDLVRPILISSMMSRDTFLRSWVLSGENDPTSITRYLREIQEQYGAFTSFFISEKSRVYYQAKGVLKTVSPEDPRDTWYFRVREMQTPYEINVDPDLANRDKLTIFINYRVFDYSDRFIGATGVGLNVDSVMQMIENYEHRYGRTIFLTDKDGRIALSGSGQSGWLDHGITHLRDFEALGPLTDDILRGEKGAFQFKEQGRLRFLNVRYIPELKWFLIVLKKEDQELEGIQRTLSLNLLACGGVVLAVLALVYWAISGYQNKIEKMATTDTLTGLANRLTIEQALSSSSETAKKQAAPLCIAMLDIDHFKAINDRYGHLLGDRVLREVAQHFQQWSTQKHSVGRWGGEEFLIVMPDTPLAKASELVDNIRRTLSETAIPSLPDMLTISAGITQLKPDDTIETFIDRADLLLYKAKNNGRNQVVSSGQPRQ